METNYELKHKSLLVPLKAILLVLAMVLVGFTTFAQQGKTVKVANDQQLIEALKNPSVDVMVLSAGFYPSVNYTAIEGTKMIKSESSGSRNLDCQYYIYDGNVCIPITPPVENPVPYDPGVPPIPPGFYWEGAARAGTLDPGGCLCCPPDSSGVWTFNQAASDYAPGDSIYFANTTNDYEMAFFVNGPGVYSLRYSWGAPYNSHVESEYVFRGPNNLELTIPDVCGLVSEADFVLDGLYSSFTFDVDWTAKSIISGIVYTIPGPDATGLFNIDVTGLEGCGLYEITATVYTHSDKIATEDACATTISTTVDFSCGPIADAGPDIYVCNDLCYSFLIGSITVDHWSPDFAYSWVQVGGPAPLQIGPDPFAYEVGVCREAYPPVCSYGTYELEFQVQNGECYDEDNTFVTFYQQPTAIAGVDRDLCNQFTFNLEAVPFGYCGIAGTNYWSTRGWELIASPAGANVDFDVNNPTALVTITGTGCIYGEYTFRWSEENSKGANLGGCFDDDDVTITIYEDPQPLAGPDLVLCETFAFSLYGTGDPACYTGTEVTYTWEKTAQPGNCLIQFTDLNVLNPNVTITNCAPCQYGKYTFTLHQSNSGVCEGEDPKDVWIFQEPDANAGADQNICYSIGNTVGFNLGASFFTGYCGTAGINYFQSGLWEFVSGPTNAVVIVDPANPASGVNIDLTSVTCPYGKYTFKWTEYNGFGTPFQGCEDVDYVDIYISETPESLTAGADKAYCNTFTFGLNGTADQPCTQATAYQLLWEVVSQPDGCTIGFSDATIVNPIVDITNCGPCPYGDYKFKLTQKNGYYTQTGEFIMICQNSDEVTVKIYQQPINVDAGLDQHLCDDFSFDLTADGADYCGVFSNWYSWTFVEGPGNCNVAFTNPTGLNTSVTVSGCTGLCPYGEFVFKFTEFNGDADVYCWDEDLVSVFIYETPVVDAGAGFALCNTFNFPLNGTYDPLCTNGSYKLKWEMTTSPNGCTANFMYDNMEDPYVTLTNCGPCPYGDYVFKLTQENGYYDELGVWVPVCWDTDEVTVTIYEQPINVDAGLDQHLCDLFTFNLTADGADYCGVYSNWYSWTLVGQPDGCNVGFTNPTGLSTGVTITGCTGACPYGEYVFKFTEFNGDADVYCWDEDLVSVFIYETPVVDAGIGYAVCNDFTDLPLNGVADPLCTGGDYKISWELISNPGSCDPVFTYPGSPITSVTLGNCGPCPYGDYIFRITQENGYYEGGVWHSVCYDTDDVTVTIYQQPEDVDAGITQNLCNDFTFDLTATGAVYCGPHSNWYLWTLVDQPGACDVAFTNAIGLSTGVTVSNCAVGCVYGEYVFKFTEWNGDASVNCEASDLVSVFIFEAPDADAGGDVNSCLPIRDFPYCTDMTGSADYCYSMMSLWTKTCGPGMVQFDDPADPKSEICFEQPGRYKFTFKVWNEAENCVDEDYVIFDLMEEPVAFAENTELVAPCDALCIDLSLAGVDKYDYTGLNADPGCPNFNDMAHWSYVDGPVANYHDATTVTFTTETDPGADLCVQYYGAYTVRWTEKNVAVDGDPVCENSVDVLVKFYETPKPLAGPKDTLCGNCYTLQGVAHNYKPYPNQHQDDYLWWESLPTNTCPVTFTNFESAVTEVCITDAAECYGTYGFVLHETNGDCAGTDTVYITFKQAPPDFAICFENDPNECGEWAGGGFPGGIDFVYNGCLLPDVDEVLEVCAEGHSYFYLAPWCQCLPGFDWYAPANWGWSFEWSLISPAGTLTQSQAGYFDFENGQWVYPYIDILWGECCDTARLYLTATNPEGCERTLEYKMFVYHKPCVNIVDIGANPGFAEVGMTSQYCNDCPPNPCLLYNWTAEHCGEITDGQGTPCIDVLWTNYNINGGWGQITLTVFDTCTGCCNYDEMPIKIFPTGTLGSTPLTGQVFYENNSQTPLNGVEVTLWNGGVPVMTTVSENKIFEADPPVHPVPYSIPGYYEFKNLNAITPFGITANYTAPWYGANATDALAVELRTISGLPGGFFVNQPLQEEAMDVNNINGINGTDALWIKQRAINMVGFFPAGNWAYEPGMSTQAVAGYNIHLLTMGDANRSNIPASMKSMPAIDLVSDGMMNVVSGEVFELPIRIAKADVFGAMTLHLEYNSSLLEVVEVATMEGMLSNISNGVVSIAWSNTNPMALADNDVVLTLKAKAIGEIASTESLFSIGINSEFASPTANVIEPVTLKSFGITTDAAALDYFLSANRPNPFSTYTTIEYTMPETGKVRLSVLDMLGQEIAVLVESTQTAGRYQVEFSAAGLATGVYLYKITVDGETRDFISTQRMVISH